MLWVEISVLLVILAIILLNFFELRSRAKIGSLEKSANKTVDKTYDKNQETKAWADFYFKNRR